MEVRCAWCEKEGVINVINQIEGPEDQISHGICPQHQEVMLQQIAAIKSSRPATNPKRRRRRR